MEEFYLVVELGAKCNSKIGSWDAAAQGNMARQGGRLQFVPWQKRMAQTHLSYNVCLNIFSTRTHF